MEDATNYTSALLFVLTFLYLSFCYVRLLTYLRYFQQEEYNSRRFNSWFIRHFAFDKRGFLTISLSLLVLHFSGSVKLSSLVLIALYLYLIYQQKDPRKIGKIKLNLTARASRIFYISFTLFIFSFLYFSLPCFSCHTEPDDFFLKVLLSQALHLQLLPFTLLISNFILSPFEKYTKLKYKNEAKSILASINPYVIGITGSYGKTSVKMALGEVLNAALAPAFCPPKSINTEMGITREIRENMRPSHKYAVIEMGAYNVGSVKRLCNLTPPKAGLVTVVGMAHLERYGSLERIYQAKSELAQAIPPDGILVCNGDNPGARKMAEENPKKTTLLYGINPELGHLDCTAGNVQFTTEGTSFDISWKNNSYKGFTKLLGVPALSNLIGVFTMACALGADPEYVLAVIRNIKPVDNRLSLSKEGNVTFLRDAYNSNPLGFEAALDVLSKLPAKRKILMTPGMIELGSEQYNQNKKAAELAAKCCDVVILVGETNHSALKDGLLCGGFNEKALIFCKSRDEAFSKLNQLIQNEDLILIENDLPDLYEVEERF